MTSNFLFKILSDGFVFLDFSEHILACNASLKNVILSQLGICNSVTKFIGEGRESAKKVSLSTVIVSLGLISIIEKGFKKES